MNKYEMLTIFNASMTDEEREALVKKYSDMMTEAGELLTVNKWGVKKLAYPMNFKKEGYYVLYEFKSEPQLPAKLSGLLNIDENVLRSLILKKEEKPEIKVGE